MLLLALSATALASGIMFPPNYQRVGEGCEPVAGGRWDPAQALRFTGYGSGATSPPGGPATHHTFPVEAAVMGLRRGDCEHEAPGRWVETGERCGPAPVLRWEGEVEAGVTYQVMVGGSDVMSLTTTGNSQGRSCPAAPQPWYVEGASTSTSSELLLPPGSVYVDQGRSAMSPVHAGLALELYALRAGAPWPEEVAVNEDGSVRARVEVRRTPVTHELSDAPGRWLCQQYDKVQVTVALVDGEARWVLEGEAGMQQTAGRCPRP